MADAWMGAYLAGEMAPTLGSQGNHGTVVGAADPLLVVGTVLEVLAARGVPVVLDHSLERATEAAGRLLRALGVEALDAWTVAL